MKYSARYESQTRIETSRKPRVYWTMALVVVASLAASCGGKTRSDLHSNGGAGQGGDASGGSPVIDAGSGGSGADAGDSGAPKCPNDYMFGEEQRCVARLGFSARSADSNDCAFALDVAPASLKLYVTIDCTLVEQLENDAGNSWSIDFASTPVRLVFAGAPCDVLKQDPNAEVDIYTYSFCL